MKKNISNLSITRFFSMLTLTSSILLVSLDVNIEKSTLKSRAGTIVADNTSTSGSLGITYREIDIEEHAYREYQVLKEEMEKEAKIRERKQKASAEYSGMALSHEYEDYIRKTAEEYNVPAELMLCLGNVETGGTWECTGVYSNGNYGNFQINWCNIDQIHNHFKWFDTVEETRDALLNDAEKNAEAAIWLVTLIIERNQCYSFQGVCQCYNGSPNRVMYANICTSYMNKFFPNKMEEVEEKLRCHTPKKEEKKVNTQLEDNELANKLDKNNVKKLV